MIDQIQLSEEEDFEFQLDEIGLVNHSLHFEFETEDFEIYISNSEYYFPIKSILMNNSITSDEGIILFLTDEQKETINDLLKKVLINDVTNKIIDSQKDLDTEIAEEVVNNNFNELL